MDGYQDAEMAAITVHCTILGKMVRTISVPNEIEKAVYKTTNSVVLLILIQSIVYTRRSFQYR
ncbi:hypothetical protein NVIE_2011 [Nitrososphaera viennensis EN76]|uniref:Uncharacterized protein n=1 Tax=Nitrososphaera viennensis EN76 TaxID=926571 RepID=A0A060HL37_9ARCH|nr:hypothetical protein NVIE_2011 [Nitrososphaera viennensis EN76]